MFGTGPGASLAKVADGARWALLSQVGQQALSVIATVVLARLLTPAEFGVVALATTVLSLTYVVLNLGLGAAIIRQEVLDKNTIDTLFTVGVTLSVLIAALLAVSAPAVAGLLGQPAATGYLRLLAAVVVLAMASGIAAALLQRELRFRV